MNDLTKQMAPIRDTLARTREKVEQIERLLVMATEAEEMEWLDAAEGAVEKARRLLAELNGKASHTVTLKPGHDHDDADPYMAVHSPADTIDRTLPPGFEVREFKEGWYPIKNIGEGDAEVFCATGPFTDQWRLREYPSIVGYRGYSTESAAYADKARWLKAAGVDWPEVTGPHGGLGTYTIRTKTHWLCHNGDAYGWRPRYAGYAVVFASDFGANHSLPAACRAWVEMQKEAAR